jgi:hypothetical protein
MINRELARKLYAQFASVPTTPENTAAFEAIARQATAIGELELAARAGLYHAILLRVSDHPAEADAAFQQVHASAVELHAGDVATRALTDRARSRNRRRACSTQLRSARRRDRRQHGVRRPRLGVQHAGAC